MLEDGDCGLVGSVKKHLASPIEQVVLSGIEVCCSLEVVGGRDKLAVFLVDLAEQIVQFAGVVRLQDLLCHLPCFGKPSQEEVRHRQVVAIFVGIGLDALCLLEKRLRFSNLSDLNVVLTQISVRVETLWFQLQCLEELFSCQSGLARVKKAGSQVCSSDCRVGLQLDGCFEVLFCLRVLRERSVHESEKLVDLEAVWGIGKKAFQLVCCGRISPGIII